VTCVRQHIEPTIDTIHSGPSHKSQALKLATGQQETHTRGPPRVPTLHESSHSMQGSRWSGSARARRPVQCGASRMRRAVVLTLMGSVGTAIVAHAQDRSTSPPPSVLHSTYSNGRADPTDHPTRTRAPCNCTTACVEQCARNNSICCATVPSSHVLPLHGCVCSTDAAPCDECATSSAHGAVTVEYDVTLGYVFGPSDAVVPIDFWTVGGVDRIKTRRTANVVNRRDNYSVYSLCAQNCEKFTPSPYWNGSHCDAWTVTVEVEDAVFEATFQCTLFEFTNLNSATPVNVPCSGCAAGVTHITWSEIQAYTVSFALIVAGYILHVIYVGWRWRHAADVKE
jgi:hypothetical protein